MSDILKPDICVIGAGSGGLTVAAAAVSLGASVVLVERGKMGGDCLNYGCVPSKALIAAAKRMHQIGDAGKFGISVDDPSVNFGKVHEHVHGVIGHIAPHDSVERFEAMGVHVIRGSAAFVDKKTVFVNGQRIKARRTVIATGSSASLPPVPGLKDVDYLTNETIFDLTRKPAHLIVIGGGPIGMEMAQAHARLGSKVTVLDRSRPLSNDDRELTDVALDQIRADGVDVREHVKVIGVAQVGKQLAVRIETKTNVEKITGSHILVAAGRAANVHGLDLELAGIKYAERGIEVGQNMKTSNRRVYAIGDVAGGLQFTHVAGYQAGLVIRNALFGLPVKMDRSIVPYVTYTDPEVAQIGMQEEEAREKYGKKIVVLRWSYAENDRAQTERAPNGMIKVITTPRGKILGAGIVGAQAGEMINMWSLAVANGLDIGAFTKMISPYPTLSEISRRAAYAFYAPKAKSSALAMVRKINRLLG